MKLIKKLFILQILLIVLFFVSVSTYVRMYGKGFLRKALISSLQRQVEFDRLSYHFPLGIKAENFRVKDVIFAKELIVQFNFNTLLKRHIILSDVTLNEPIIKISHGLNTNSGPIETVDHDQSQEDNGVKEKPPIIIDKINIVGGKIQYTKPHKGQSHDFLFYDVQLTARSIVLPLKSNRTTFHVQAFLGGDGQLFSGSELEGHGWVDFVKKDMEADVRLNQKARNIVLLAALTARDNEMLVEGEIKAHQVRLNQNKIKVAQMDSSEILTLTDKDVDVSSKFSFETKMDDFKLTRIAFKGSVEAP